MKLIRTSKKTAKVKGFRPGKAPRTVLEGLYKKQVNADVSSKLIQDSFKNAIEETKLVFLGNPVIDPPEFEGKGPYKYDATIEIHPEIGYIDFKGLELKKNIYKVTDEEINAQIEMLRKKLAEYNPIEEVRDVKEGDFVAIDYEGFKDGEPFEDIPKTQDQVLKVGTGDFSKEFEDKLMGMKPGESGELNVTFPEEHPNKKIAGNEITFHITLKDIRDEVLPEIDDEFAKKLGNHESLDSLKNEIAGNLKEGYEKRTEQELNEQIFKEFLAKQDFEVPDIMVDYELEGIIQETEKSFLFRGTNMEEQLGMTREEFGDKYRETAVKQVRRHLVLAKLIEQENLTLSDEDLENGFMEMSKNTGHPVSEIKNHYEQNKDNLEFFKNTLLEKQAVKLIIDNSTIEEIEAEKENQESGS
jgi:trigger factor